MNDVMSGKDFFMPESIVKDTVLRQRAVRGEISIKADCNYVSTAT